MSKQALKPESHVILDGLTGKTVLWNNIKLGEIKDENLATIIAASFDTPVYITFRPVMRNGKRVMEIYGGDVPESFRRLVEVLNEASRQQDVKRGIIK